MDQIAGGIKQVFGITLEQLREKGKSRDISSGRKLTSLVAKEYEYKGQEIAEYLQKDPAIITRYFKEREEFKMQMDRVLKTLVERKSNVNK